MTKTYGNFTDFIDFSRASSGTTLRKVSYGAELVDTANTTTPWTAAGTNTVEQDGDAVKVTYVDTTNGATALLSESGGLSESITVGKLYQISFQTKATGASQPVVVLVNGVEVGRGNADSTTYKSYTVNFFADGVAFSLKANVNSGESVWIKDISVKEVTFDQPDGTLELFNHPAGIPRIEYDANGNELGLLIEEQRTNLVTYSEAFDNSAWAKTNTATLTVDAIGPDGKTSAVTLADSGATGSGSVYVREDVTVSASTTYTFSCYLKADQVSYGILRVSGFTTPLDSGVWFDLSGGTIGTEENTVTGQIESIGSGWYRCLVTFTTDVSDTTGNVRVYSASADNNYVVDLDGTSSILIYGAQLEQGSFATSYIPTSGSTVSRSPDIASIATSNFGYNKKAGTVVVEYRTFTAAGTTRIAELEADASNRITMFNGAEGETLSAFVNDGGVTQADINTGNTAAVGFNTGGWAFKENDVNICLNGGSVVSDISATIPSVDTLLIGDSNAAGYLNGHIKSLSYRPRRLTSAQLQKLTG